MKKNVIIPICIGIAIIIVGIIAIYNQELEIVEPQIIKPEEVEINYNNSESQEISDIEEWLNSVIPPLSDDNTDTIG